MFHSLIQQSLIAGRQRLDKRSNAVRKAHGQYLTPLPLAQYMAAQLTPIANADRILDPAMGSGTLLCAVIEQLINQNQPFEVHIDGFELDAELFATAQMILQSAVARAAEQGIIIHLRLFQTDFVLNGLRFLRPSLLESPVGYRYYQHIIANPPYFKINAQDARRQAAEGMLQGYTNIYTLFMGLAARMLQRGRACFLVPRSFCSGAYFARFRRDFISCVTLKRIHLFEARDSAFRHDDVLQENLVMTFAPSDISPTPLIDMSTIDMSTSEDLNGLESHLTFRQITSRQFVSPGGLFRLPTSPLDDLILDIIDDWPASLDQLNMEISTGPVVPFRAKDNLVHTPDARHAVPLLWMQHIRPQQVHWPLTGDFRKPQYIADAPSLRVENVNYVLLRRFSAKEDVRRLVAAPYLAAQFPYQDVGLENHLNYIYCRHQPLTDNEAIGLSALLNSGVIDRYFRIANGHTQVNAAEIRALPLPPWDVIQAIGTAFTTAINADLDAVVTKTLQTFALLPVDFPVLRETRHIAHDIATVYTREPYG